ncbi:MAG: tubulin/FtsZ family protein [Methanocorpusculum sp.]|uniref:tubulin/FtsZ family protein n=1 Tax=Methanocorpusculum sp. TaxID=2058474 RepID=UPI002717C656|nr:tubulin/FtsZ family protein [Methanocorpusculum sp.]MDO9522891.1 tubulin/FtsZ family protein [Methanocorpusculum sp.]
MRALLIGVGGAGCRIVETLSRHDAKSGVKSVRSYVFDSDRDLINRMSGIPAVNRIVLTPIDPVKKVYDRGTDFDTGHLASCFQDAGVDEVDAIFVCAGLGGRMAELVPDFVKQLSSAFPDPVFTILTLPGRNEGIKVSAHASETLEAVRAVTSASLLFDNETWYTRITEDISLAAEKNGVAAKPTLEELYPRLNEDLAARVGLLLRAGEFGLKGVESAEVVLDAGEILNTLTGMDLVAVGYAVEKLPTAWSSFMKRLRVEEYLLNEGHLRTSRIVELAKKAVYEEISVPCDLTSADKALILISGPSKELSMKGFQTVRKWIDRSIRGLEMRAGDYPVKSKTYVGVIIVLAGIENVPRVAELDEIRMIYESEQTKVYGFEEITDSDIPLLTMAKDEVIFEDELVDLGEIPEEQDDDLDIGGPMEFEDEEIFEERIVVEQTPDPEDDLFEIDPVIIPTKPVRTPVAAPPKKEPPKKKDPQILVGGPKKVEKIDNTIPLPKREKKEDGVLSGKANVGGNDKPKEMYGGERKPAVGTRKRPDASESGVLEGSISMGRGQQLPRETDGHVRMADTQRPRETDGHVRMADTQRPKDTSDDKVRMKTSQRPNDTGGSIRAGSSQRAKDDTAGIKMQGNKIAKDVNQPIRVTSIPLPKNIDGKVEAKKKKQT